MGKRVPPSTYRPAARLRRWLADLTYSLYVCILRPLNQPDPSTMVSIKRMQVALVAAIFAIVTSTVVS